MGSWVPFPGCLLFGSWVPFPGCLFMGSWDWDPGCFLFFYFTHSATTLAQVYDIDFVFNRVNILLVMLGIWIFDLNLVYRLVVVCSWPTVSCEMTPFPALVAFFVVARFAFAFAFAVDLAFALALIAILALPFALALAVAAAFAFALAFALAFPFCLCSPRTSELFLWSHSRSTSCSCSRRAGWLFSACCCYSQTVRVHQQMVSQFLWAFSQHHADLHVIVQLCCGEIFVDVHLMFPRLPRFLKLCRIITHSRL